AAIEADRKLEPRSPISRILAAHVSRHLADVAAALEELQAAAKLAPDDAAIWYEIYNTCSGRADEALRDGLRAPIAAAIKADPVNSYLLKQQLVVEAEGKDEHVLETLAALWTQIEPIVASVKQKYRVDLESIAGQLKAAV